MKKHLVTILLSILVGDLALAGPAADILKEAGVTGGLVVHVGCGDGTLTAALRANDGYLVQGLDTSAENVAKARRLISDAGLYGTVTARTFDGRSLPYRDNMVNLVVVSDPQCQVPNAEVMRVLAPKGVAFVNGRKQVKPRPGEIDEWTHYQHDPQGTMVGLDQVVAPPVGIQWMGDPKWLRNHDFMSSMHAMVAAGGKVFYVIDEGLKNHIFLPSHWVLIARDAFNGTVLWRRDLKDWYPNNWPLKSGPGQFPRRLVATGERVFVTFGQTEPLTALDAVTGKTLRTYDGTKATEEVIFADGALYLLVNPARKPVDYRAEGTSYKEIGRASSSFAWTPAGPPESVAALDAESGRSLWTHESKVAPLSLTVSEDKVYFHNGGGMVALDRKTGKRLWASQGPAIKSVGTGGALRAVYSDGVLVFAQGTRVTGLAAKDGKQLWTGSLLASSHHCPNDLFVIDGQIWSANTGTPQKTGTHLKAIDLHTGEVTKDFRAENLPAFPMHPRCYPSRATTRYLLTNGIGTEFYRLGETKVDIYHYVRGSCVYGVMPCNGLLYKPPDSCACYYQSKLEYFCALSPASALQKPAPEADRLEKGPAFSTIANRKPKTGNDDWPMYRRDAARSGSCPSAPTGGLGKLWSVELGGKLTQPVVADGKAFVSSIDQQTLYALDAGSGKVLWKHIAGGKIDSSPTLHKGTVLFGCADGWVYCLRAEDGALAWRYLVAPADTQIVSCQHVESVWPVHGSVLIVNDTLYALAGRNLFFDGGMRLVRLDAGTGRKISETVLDEKDPATGKNLQTLIVAKYMPIANPDIFSSDGKRLYMQEQNFDLEGKRLTVAPTQPGGKQEADRGGRHLFCQTGLLDDAWFHRSFWIYGDDCGEGWSAYAGTRRTTPCGRIMAFDQTRVYAFRSEPLGNMLHPRTTYTLYAADKDPAAVAEPAPAPTAAAAGAKKARRGAGKRAAGGGFKEHWGVETPGLLVNAMVLAKDRLFLAGPPDVADETKMLGFLPGAADDINRQLRAQDDAWRGKQGGLLRAVSVEDGRKLAEYKLDGVPIFDGMSAAGGKLLMSLTSGHVACFGAK
ncbi:MAG TPA: PQQ-binding-like beta-propeller repeat protein [Phycisphaerae bacterium]|nr:PQQ-binding-like beta-propeller repeat protein [Phycisphaerae bacterium]